MKRRIPSSPAARLPVSFAVFTVLLAFGAALLARDALAEAARPKLFLHCPKTCFEPYLRQELSYFDLVRDRHEAELQVSVARQPTASTGERFTVVLTLTGGQEPPLVEELTTPPATQPEAARQRLLGVVLRLLYRRLESSSAAAAFELRLPKRSGVKLSRVEDPWDHWAVSPELKAAGEAQSAFYFGVVTSSVTVRRMTEKNKLRLRLAHEQLLSRYEVEDGRELRGDAQSWWAQLLYARSLGRHWALGFAGTERASQQENLTAHVHGGPVLELNLFPYSDNASKQLRVAYQAGPWLNWYAEPSVRGRRHDVRGYQALSVVVDANQRWGSVQWALQLNSLLDEPARYRLGSALVGSLQLFEGFAVNATGMGSWVNDQINLRARPLSDTELLLGTAEARTSFLLELELGLSYTFGSVHNSIVNPRFGRLDLQED